jgi:hypothetical protein
MLRAGPAAGGDLSRFLCILLSSRVFLCASEVIVASCSAPSALTRKYEPSAVLLPLFPRARHPIAHEPIR